jgi:hypothetical protein
MLRRRPRGSGSYWETPRGRTVGNYVIFFSLFGLATAVWIGSGWLSFVSALGLAVALIK